MESNKGFFRGSHGVGKYPQVVFFMAQEVEQVSNLKIHGVSSTQCDWEGLFECWGGSPRFGS